MVLLGRAGSDAVLAGLLAMVMLRGAAGVCPVMEPEPAGKGGKPKPGFGLIGGWTPSLEPDEELAEVLADSDATKRLIAMINSEEDGETSLKPEDIDACFYAKQVVAGVNYKVIMNANDDCQCYYKVIVHTALPYTGESARVTDIKKVPILV
eukprot:TRINITY_DN34637_c0_g1_i1.p1 TRINITY_DN34637_c0_g1~~TRINITY_DN34637_c0_g1_i1.p1  ORF type:complete len:152 (-),score=40.97 TRINITY_DN34637_c0_g1_i1:282-737(-)